MQDNLKGRTILVGKEPQKGRLLVSVKINGQPKTAAIGLPGSVPACVSRCIAAQDVAHFRLDISRSGAISITNLKPQNVTFVNGAEIIKKTISENSAVTLGKDRFPINLKEVLATASKIVDVVIPPAPKEFSIRPLKEVWDDYEYTTTRQRVANGRFAALASASGLFTIGSIVISALPNFNPNIRYVMYGMAFVLILITIIKRLYDATNQPKIQKEQREDFQRNYVCPNPDCHHFVGNQPYNIISQSKKCPYCGCTWTH